MSGRKQHHIPQLLMRGFTARKTKKKSQVWFFSHDTAPICTATENILAQRDFYGEEIDNKITLSEHELDTFVFDIRDESIDFYLGKDPRAVNLILSISVRTRWIRLLASSVSFNVVESFVNKSNNPDFLYKLFLSEIKRDPEWWTNKLRESLIAAGVDDTHHDFESNLQTASEMFFDTLSDNSELFLKHLDLDVIQKLGFFVQKEIPIFTRNGHLEAIERSFDEMPLRNHLKEFNWKIIRFYSNLILGDFGPLFISNDSGLTPMFISRPVDVDLIILPVSSRLALLGFKKEPIAGPCAHDINLASAAWSSQGFVSSENSSHEQDLHRQLSVELNRYLNKLNKGLFSDLS